MQISCNKYIQFVNIIIKMNILSNVCLNKSYLYINVFTYFYPVVLVKLMCVYYVYILCDFVVKAIFSVFWRCLGHISNKIRLQMICERSERGKIEKI